ncbi:lipopolysaccharide biosynthesis protein [Tenacibaculum holothuriorum]|uniref:lipopolysaccharide biosynthesis protein n=1 Tax=Tenacibaculum holothuriorum TaxID=1635173 RepID=UPI0013022186|nr:oligosaccharide flippase family protein [Tenacibaculum holothuriorum]
MSLTILYSIGNLSSKVINFVLVFFITFYLSQKAVGEFDLILITLGLLSPFVTFQLTDSALRWLLDNDSKENAKQVFSTVTIVFLISHSIFLFFIIIYDYFLDLKYLKFIYFLLLSQSFCQFFLQCVRGLAKNNLYVISGVINSAVYVLFAVLFLYFTKLGVEGLLYSSIISTVLTSIVLLIKGGLYEFWELSYVSVSFAKKLLKYSMPLIPNSLSWWAVSSANRYVILLYLGAGANGIFAISYKLPTILLMLTNIFYLAWQEKAILNHDEEDRDIYYSTVLRQYLKILFAISIMIVGVNKVLLSYIVEDSFFDAWRYTPLLLFSIILSSIAGFYGTGYLGAKKTKGALISSVVGGVVAVVFSFLLIPKYSLYGASLAIVLGYLCLLLVRIKHMKSIMNIDFPIKLFVSLLLTLLLVSSLNHINEYIMYINVILSIIIATVICKDNLLNILSTLKNKIYQ